MTSLEDDPSSPKPGCLRRKSVSGIPKSVSFGNVHRIPIVTEVSRPYTPPRQHKNFLARLMAVFSWIPGGKTLVALVFLSILPKSFVRRFLSWTQGHSFPLLRI
eukprot:c11931_g1_i1.p1 GENE.c11931_g1_i1~~c11931_g1_i1.p1  ORF type:complete len:104 (+),score=4.05 c11931_g1_i1:53-364(+)